MNKICSLFLFLGHSGSQARRRSPACTPRRYTKQSIRHIGAHKFALSAGGLLGVPAVGYLAYALMRRKFSLSFTMSQKNYSNKKRFLKISTISFIAVWWKLSKMLRNSTLLLLEYSILGWKLLAIPNLNKEGSI